MKHFLFFFLQVNGKYILKSGTDFRQFSAITMNFTEEKPTVEIEAVEGPGSLEWRIERMDLMEGRYELSLACYDETLSHPYDHHHRRYPLQIRRGPSGEVFGLVTMPATWAHRPGEAPPPEPLPDALPDTTPDNEA